MIHARLETSFAESIQYQVCVWFGALFVLNESNFLRHFRRMEVAQMPVSFHGECTAVFMAKPAGNSRNVHARFNATSGKQMAQIMMGKAGDLQFSASRVNGFLTFTHTDNRTFLPLLFRLFGTDTFQQPEHIGNHRNDTDLRAALSGALLPAAF